MSYPIYPQIDPKSWEHPFDKAALETLRRIPRLDDLLRHTLGAWSESSFLHNNREELILVTKAQSPKLHRLYSGILNTFDVQTPWPLYIKNEAGVNAYAIGIKEPFITLTLDAAQMSEASVRMILAHEIGHLLAGHGLYRTMLRFLLSVGWLSGLIPAQIPIYLGVTLAMLEWRRCSEFTADRASALASGNADSVVRVLNLFDDPTTQINQMLDELNHKVPEFMRPVLQESLNGIRRLTQTHPDPSVRIEELQKWCASPEFIAFQRGDYPKRGRDKVATSEQSFQADVSRIAGEAKRNIQDIWKEWNPF